MTDSNTQKSNKPGPAKIAALAILAVVFVVVLLLPDKSSEPPPAAAAGNRRPPVRRPGSTPAAPEIATMRPTEPPPPIQINQVIASNPFESARKSDAKPKQPGPAKMVQKARRKVPVKVKPIAKHPYHRVVKQPLTMRLQSGDRLTIRVGDKIIHQGRDEKNGVWLRKGKDDSIDLRLFPPRAKKKPGDSRR